ncbi:hypothetical protein A3Q56_02536 [Intoshia linei]|uniref:Uncharacterized protein n=1 Tax=Intoshia linei TaxID=1819745 RepID=A0A177B7Q4_9BILA|nr:hypothetical protein A3Q56_02536 [Intoshia linei]
MKETRKNGLELPLHPLQICSWCVFLYITTSTICAILPGMPIVEYSIFMTITILMMICYTITHFIASCIDPIDPLVGTRDFNKISTYDYIRNQNNPKYCFSMKRQNKIRPLARNKRRLKRMKNRKLLVPVALVFSFDKNNVTEKCIAEIVIYRPKTHKKPVVHLKLESLKLHKRQIDLRLLECVAIENAFDVPINRYNSVEISALRKECAHVFYISFNQNQFAKSNVNKSKRLAKTIRRGGSSAHLGKHNINNDKLLDTIAFGCSNQEDLTQWLIILGKLCHKNISISDKYINPTFEQMVNIPTVIFTLSNEIQKVTYRNSFQTFNDIDTRRVSRYNFINTNNRAIINKENDIFLKKTNANGYTKRESKRMSIIPAKPEKKKSVENRLNLMNSMEVIVENKDYIHKNAINIRESALSDDEAIINNRMSRMNTNMKYNDIYDCPSGFTNSIQRNLPPKKSIAEKLINEDIYDSFN